MKEKIPLTIKKVMFCLYFFILSSRYIHAQSMYVQNTFTNSSVQDQKAIRMMLDGVTQGIRLRNFNRVLNHFDDQVITSEGSRNKRELLNYLGYLLSTNENDLRSFLIDSIFIEKNGDAAELKTVIKDVCGRVSEGINFKLLRDDRRVWKIVSCGKFFPSVEKIYGLPKVFSKNNITGKDIFVEKLTSDWKNISSSSTVTTIITSDHLLIPKPYGYDGSNSPIWQVTRADAQSVLNKSLFANPVDGDYVAVTKVGQDIHSVSFTLDRDWRRIIYGGDVGDWLKSYGDWPGDYHFGDPVAMKAFKLRTTPAQWLIYIADKENCSLAKFKYDLGTQNITYLSSILINITQPVDVEILPLSQGITPPPLLIADAGAGLGSIKCIDQGGNLYFKIENYTYNNTTYRLNKPLKAVYLFNLDIAFIDEERNSIVTIDPNNIPVLPNTTASATNVVQFSSPSKLNSIGFGYWSEYFYVTDYGLDMVHKFSGIGEYLASFSMFNSNRAVNPSEFNGATGISLFTNPIMFGSSNMSNPDIGILDMYTLNEWTNSSGFRRFLPGADIVNFSAACSNSSIAFYYTFTNNSAFNSKIYNSSNIIVFDFYPFQGSALAGSRVDQINYSQLSSGVFTLKITAEPLDNDSYVSSGHDRRQNPVEVSFPFITYPSLTAPLNNVDCVSLNPTLSWQPLSIATSYQLQVATNNIFTNPIFNQTVTNASKQLGSLSTGTTYYWRVRANYAGGISGWSNIYIFKTIEPPHINYFNSNSYCIYWNETANLTCDATPKNCITYDWNIYCNNYIPSGATFTYSINSNVAYLSNNNVQQDYTIYPCVRVYNQVNDDLENLSSPNWIILKAGNRPPPSPPSCPYLFTWDGNRYRKDNNILPQSTYLNNIGKDITDYYKLTKPLILSDGVYKLQIREFESELSYIDKVKLLAVDHPIGTKTQF